MKKKCMLVILDGWGIGNAKNADAIAAAQTPFMDKLLQTHPHSTLRTSGEDVGLPDGQMGNSEVGHLNIGAGRVVYQDLVKINKAVREHTLDTNAELVAAMQYAQREKKNIHLLGLVSDGGVHSAQEHLHGLCRIFKQQNIPGVFVHAFTDGRDTDPKSGYGFIKLLLEEIEDTGAKLASICGRYYAMDRDKRWERVKLAYDLLVSGKGTVATDALAAIEKNYAAGVTDEFLQPIVMSSNGTDPVAVIRPGDVVLCFNFRTDRCREITEVLTQRDMPEQGMHTLPLYYVTMTNYDDSYRDVHVLYDKDNLESTLGEVIEQAGGTQIRIAETEKYPHVTFFFSGGREVPFKGESRMMIPSPKVATYDLQPEMSARELTAAILPELEKGAADFICLNYANADMVGHTGVFSAVVKAVETVDNCLQQVVETGMKAGYSFIIIADHGNADYMINSDGTPNTAHTTNPVPCILIDDTFTSIGEGRLADVAPTILKIMGIPAPAAMDGKALV